MSFFSYIFIRIIVANGGFDMDDDFFEFLMVTGQLDSDDTNESGCSGCLVPIVLGVILILLFL